jgi:hypothetical protein
MRVFTVIGTYNDGPKQGETYATFVRAKDETHAVDAAHRCCLRDNGISANCPSLVDIVAVVHGQHQVWCPGD